MTAAAFLPGLRLFLGAKSLTAVIPELTWEVSAEGGVPEAGGVYVTLTAETHQKNTKKGQMAKKVDRKGQKSKNRGPKTSITT